MPGTGHFSALRQHPRAELVAVQGAPQSWAKRRCSFFPFTAFTMLFHSLLFLRSGVSVYVTCHFSLLSRFAHIFNFKIFTMMCLVLTIKFIVCYLPIISCLQMYVFHENFRNFVIISANILFLPHYLLMLQLHMWCTVFVSSNKSLILC